MSRPNLQAPQKRPGEAFNEISNIHEMRPSTSSEMQSACKRQRIEADASENCEAFSDGLFERIARGLERSLQFSKKLSQRLETSDSDGHTKNHTIQFSTRLVTGATLREYQENGVKWLIQLKCRNLNGILADEMGLGKTLQSITFISSLITSGIRGPFLIVAPYSTVKNWKNEFNKFAPGVPVVLIPGSREERVVQQKKILVKRDVPGVGPIRPVVILAYTTLKLVLKQLIMIKWSYIIFDEAAYIKNSECELFKNCQKLSADGKLLLTGTPLQNDIKELWNLLHFILPKVFHDFSLFQQWIEGVQTKGQDVQKSENIALVKLMHELLTPFFLRRTKESVNLNLPPRKTVMIFCPLTEIQQSYYKNILARLDPTDSTEDKDTPLTPRKTKLKARRVIANHVRCLNARSINVGGNFLSCEDDDEEDNVSIRTTEDLLKLRVNTSYITKALRRVVAHPWLIASSKQEDGYYPNDEFQLRTLSGKMSVLFILLKKLIANGHKVLIFSTFVMSLDLIQMLLIMNDMPYFYLRGDVNLEERQDAIDRFNCADSPEKIFLISTKCGGLGINLCGADTVIFYDSDWNPQADIQAADRCYRIGQTKRVVTYRLLCKGTIDERIMETGTKKRALEKVIVNCGKFDRIQSDKKLSEDELCEALRAVDFDKCVKFPSEEEIEKLADRDYVFSEDCF